MQQHNWRIFCRWERFHNFTTDHANITLPFAWKPWIGLNPKPWIRFNPKAVTPQPVHSGITKTVLKTTHIYRPTHEFAFKSVFKNFLLIQSFSSVLGTFQLMLPTPQALNWNECKFADFCSIRDILVDVTYTWSPWIGMNANLPISSVLGTF